MGSVSGGNFSIEENSLFRSCVLKTLPALKDIVRLLQLVLNTIAYDLVKPAVYGIRLQCHFLSLYERPISCKF